MRFVVSAGCIEQVKSPGEWWNILHVGCEILHGGQPKGQLQGRSGWVSGVAFTLFFALVTIERYLFFQWDAVCSCFSLHPNSTAIVPRNADDQQEGGFDLVKEVRTWAMHTVVDWFYSLWGMNSNFSSQNASGSEGLPRTSDEPLWDGSLERCCYSRECQSHRRLSVESGRSDLCPASISCAISISVSCRECLLHDGV